MPQSDFSKAIQAARDEGWSDTELADFFSVTPATVERWARGDVLPAPMVRAVMLKRLGFGPLNQCSHPNMQSDDGVHLYCPDCGLEWDDASEGAQSLEFWEDYMQSKEEWDDLAEWNE